MNYFKNRLLILSTLVLSSLPATSQAVEMASDNSSYCYSAYHLQQEMDVVVNFADTIQRKKTIMDVDIHVREILSDRLASNEHPEVRSFIILASPNYSKVNGVEVDMSQRYQHPFIVWMDAESGELIDLKSNLKDKAVLNEYLSFYDLFQYTEHTGEYIYRNGNGRYLATVSNAENDPQKLIRENSGYQAISNNKQNHTQLIDSVLEITLDDSQSECFYQKSNGFEFFNTNFSAKASVEGDAKIAIESDSDRALSSSHIFFTLTDNLLSWPQPQVEIMETISTEEALARLPMLMTQLSLMTDNNSQFFDLILREKDIWPYLTDYILQNELTNELSVKLFWALDKIDTPESVTTLATLATSPLPAREHMRAVLALGSTSASFDSNSVQQLQNHMSNYSNPQFSQPDNLTFIRMLGAMANRRNDSDPVQSREIRNFLYSQVGVYDESVNAAVIDAIGNLKNSIDQQGESLLLENLSSHSDAVRLAAVGAFTRVPYKAQNSEQFIRQLGAETSPAIQNRLVDVMSQTTKSDLKVKDQLLSLVENPSLRSRSLVSVKKIGFELNESDIHMLEARLRKESDSKNQRVLAALILKHRRQ